MHGFIDPLVCPASTIARDRIQDLQAMTDSLDDKIIDTPDGPMTWAEWKKKNPVQLASRRSKGKDLPNKVRRRTDDT